MSTVDSTATLEELKTDPPVNGKGYDLPTVLANPAAPRYDGQNLFIQIDVHSDDALFHSQLHEHVGTHQQRHVLFCANEHCWLIFKNQSVFVETHLELMKGEKIAAHVADSTRDVDTECVVRVSATRPGKVARKMDRPNVLHGPVIFVP